MFICSVKSFSQGNPDVNGKLPVYLQCENGILPERARVLSGTIADSLDLQVGTMYAINVTHTGQGEYGPTYKHSVIGALTTMEFLKLGKDMPKAELLVDIKKPVNANPVTVTAEGDEADF
jgi:hypothetical protein